MYKEILRNVDNVEIWPIISFIIFFLFFLFLLLWVFTVDKKFIRHMKELPLSDDASKEHASHSPEQELITKTSISR